MGEIVPFKKPEVKKRGLCQHGFHRWVVDNSRKFDVHQGKLVTRYVCSRCGAEKVKAL